MGKHEAVKAWRYLSADGRANAIASLPAFRAYCAAKPDYRPIPASRYLSKRRFEGFVASRQASALSGSTTAFIVKGTPQWDAWLQHRRVRSFST